MSADQLTEVLQPDIARFPRARLTVSKGPDKGLEVVLEGLSFSNGVALASDRSFVAVAETRAHTVVRHWLTGPRAGTRVDRAAVRSRCNRMSCQDSS